MQLQFYFYIKKKKTDELCKHFPYKSTQFIFQNKKSTQSVKRFVIVVPVGNLTTTEGADKDGPQGVFW